MSGKQDKATLKSIKSVNKRVNFYQFVTDLGLSNKNISFQEVQNSKIVDTMVMAMILFSQDTGERMPDIRDELS